MVLDQSKIKRVIEHNDEVYEGTKSMRKQLKNLDLQTDRFQADRARTDRVLAERVQTDRVQTDRVQTEGSRRTGSRHTGLARVIGTPVRVVCFCTLFWEG